MKRRGWLSLLLSGLCLLMTPGASFPAQSSSYPASVGEEIKSLLAAGVDQSSDPVFLTKLADLYLDAGDDLYTKKRERLRAYEEGARIALRVVDIQETNADAHYLYAANLGSGARLKGLISSALTVGALKKHLARALELEPDHASAMHMMGMLLEDLPGMFGGDSGKALMYLEGAVAVEPNYTHARLDLAKAYMKRGDMRAADRELRLVINSKLPVNPYTWARRHKPEARELLRELENP